MRDLGTALEDRWEASNTERWWVAAQTECARGLCGISNRDEIIGTRFSRGFRRGYVWRAGKPTDLTTSGLDYAVPSAVNDRGEIVGLTMEIGTQEATLWRGKSATFLPNLDRPSIEWAYARAINEQRQIVGENQGEYGRLGLATHAVLWTWQPAR